MPDIDIKNVDIQNVQHCGKCDALIDGLFAHGISSIKSLPSPCFYKADNLNYYLLQCIVESYKEKNENYVKPAIVSDNRYDHYTRTYTPDNYELKDFIVNGDSNVYLVHGEAGIGKSTFLNELYFEISLYSLKNEWTILPIMFRMEEFGSDNFSPKEWMKKQLGEKYYFLNFEPAFFNPDICVVFFLDAINDIQYTNYNDLKNKLDTWRQFIESSFRHYKNIKFIISSRYLDYLSDFEINNYTRLFIQPYNDEQISMLINYKNCSESTKQQLFEIINSNKELPFLKNPFFLNKLMSTYQNKIKNRTDIINAFLNSIFSTRNAFIRNRKKRQTVNGFEYFDIQLKETTFFEALSKIAFDNQKSNKLDINMEDIENVIHEDSSQFVDLARVNSIFSENTLKFTHPIFQEYFSGRHIFAKLPEDYGIENILVFDNDIRLIQSLKHVYNLVTDKEKMISLLINNGKLNIAAECVLEDMEPKLKDMVTSAIILHLTQFSSDIKESFDLGFLLGKLGDSRIISGVIRDRIIEPQVATISSKPSLKVGIYPVTNLEYSYFIKDGGYSNIEYWEDINSLNWLDFDTRVRSICDFWYKIQDKLNSSQERFFQFCLKNNFDKELIAHLCFFKAIPRVDFEVMIKDLYSEEKNQKPLMWDNPTYNNPSQPVIGVSIYEAFAYCAWLSKRTQKRYRLLTNDEWEMISESTHKSYVYGNTLNKLVSNTSESDIKMILPVGICKKNISKDGIFDLTGNIFEWTSTIYRDEIDDMFVQYICKGGSWIQDSLRAKSSYIGRGMAWVRNLDLGFRICYDEN